MLRTRLHLLQDELAQFYSRFSPSDISIYYRLRPSPYGGGNQFLRALSNRLQSRSYRVAHRSISPQTQACLFNSHHYEPDRLARIRQTDCRMVHRVDGPIDLIREEDKGVDRWIAEQNARLADTTVFQSDYSYQQHLELGLQFKSPHIIINAPDPDLFFKAKDRPLGENGKIRLIASSWSSNMRKGFKIYQWLDRNLDWSKYRFTFVGNSPIRFKNIEMVQPLPSVDLADLLRAHDIYITGSQKDPCSNALLEALHCGLPALFLKSGGHPELVGEGGYGFESAEEIPALLVKMVENYETLCTRIKVQGLDEVVDRYLQVMGIDGVAGARK